MSETNQVSLSFKSQFEEFGCSHLEGVTTMVSVTAPSQDIPEEERAGVDIVCCIDVSGSMSGQKIALVKQTLQHVVRELSKQDQFGVVIFSDHAEVRLPLVCMDNEGKETAKRVIAAMNILNSTNISEGLSESIQVLRNTNKTCNKVRSILLFTDGQANMGITNAEGIVAMVSLEKESGRSSPLGGKRLKSFFGSIMPSRPSKQSRVDCSIHCFGFGSDHDSMMLKSVSDANNGLYLFVEKAEQIPALFANCFGGLVSSVASQITLDIEATYDTKISKVWTGYPVTVVEEGRKYKVSIYDLQQDEKRDFPVEISLPACNESCEIPVLKFALNYTNLLDSSNPRVSVPLLGFIKREINPKPEQTEDPDIGENIQRLRTAEIINEVTKLGLQGDYQSAKNIIEKEVKELKQVAYASKCDYLVQNLEDLDQNMDSFNFGSKGLMQANNYVTEQYQQRSAGISSERFITKKRKSMAKKFA